MADRDLVLSSCSAQLNAVQLPRSGMLGFLARRPISFSEEFALAALDQAKRCGFRGSSFIPDFVPLRVSLCGAPATTMLAWAFAREPWRSPISFNRRCRESVQGAIRRHIMQTLQEVYFEDPAPEDALDVAILLLASNFRTRDQEDLLEATIAQANKLIKSRPKGDEVVKLATGGGYWLRVLRYVS